jgi:hypothetical protein
MRATLVVLALVATPAVPTLAGDPPPDAVLAELPFAASDAPNRIYVDLAPPGSASPFQLSLATEAEYSGFTPRAAREAGVNVRANKRTDYRRRTALGVDLLFIVDTRSSDSGARQVEDALLGGNFLEQFPFEIDFAARRVRFFDPKRYRVPETADAGEAVLPLRVVARRPAIEIQVDAVPVWALVATRFEGGLGVSGPDAERAGLQRLGFENVGIQTQIGPTGSDLADVRSLRIGPFEIRAAPAVVTPRGIYNLGQPGDAVVGYDVLSQFTVRFDYAGKRVWLRPNPTVRSVLMGIDWRELRDAGVLLWPISRGFRVDGVRGDGPAARRGLRAGDRFEGGRDAATILADLREGREVVVVRDVDGVGVDTVLPAAGGLEPPAP